MYHLFHQLKEFESLSLYKYKTCQYSFIVPIGSDQPFKEELSIINFVQSVTNIFNSA